MNPLEKIESWVFLLDAFSKDCILTAIEKNKNQYGVFSKDGFLLYLRSENLHPDETAKRCLIAIYFINDAIFDSVNCWRVSIDTSNFNIQSKEADWIFKVTPEENEWIKTARSWNNLLKSHLLNDELIEWVKENANEFLN